MQRIFSLAAVLVLGMTVSAFADEPWVPLFDGKSLDGWTVRGGTAKYKAEDGMIVGTTVEGSPNTFLCRGPYDNFELEFDVKCDKALNSGVQIRSHVYEKDTPQPSNTKRIRKAGEVYGYQCEIAPAEEGVSGNFWDEGRHTKWLDDLSKKPGAAAAFINDEWNHYRIVAQGDRIRSWVNGVPCADFRDSTDATGFIGLQVHSIRAGAGPYQVRWKNIRLRVLAGDKISENIEKILREQAVAWNAGDIDAFMQHYWKSDELTFSSSGKTTRGWEPTKANYQLRYPTRESMGRLTFDQIEITSLGDSAALVLGRFHLMREPMPVSGGFSLVLRQIDGRWVIVHDHTSRDG